MGGANSLTVDAVVCDLQIVLEVLGTASFLSGIIVPRVGHPDGAVTSPATQLIRDAHDVTAAADEAVVASDTATDVHPSIASRCDHHDRRRAATGLKFLVLTEFYTRHESRRHTNTTL